MIKQVEEFDRQGEWAMYDGHADCLEVGAKYLYAIKRITKEQYYAILRRYRSF